MLKKSFKKIDKESDFLAFRIAIVTSRYHRGLTGKMESGCIKALVHAGVKKENIESFEAPGSWEIPVIVENILRKNVFDGVAAFGIVLKGDTYHFEMIANECSRGLMEISLKHGVPVAFEVLAVYSLEQAIERTTRSANKGIEAANALLQSIGTIRRLKKSK